MTGPESKVSVSVEEMERAVAFASGMVLDGIIAGPFRDGKMIALAAARDYILTAQSALAERDVEITELQWSYVPQDVAMECREMLLAAGFGKPGTGNTLHGMVQQACALIAELRLVTGPKCPKCGHWLKARHLGPQPWDDTYLAAFVCQEDCHCVLMLVDLLASHPALADELGLTKEPSNAN